MITYQKESMETMWDDFIENSMNHWDETEGYRHDQPFAPDKERFLQYEKAGMYYSYSARDGEILAGHFTMYVSQSMHTQLLTATEDTMYIRPEYRGKRIFYKLYSLVEKEMKDMGVMEIMLTTKLTNTVGDLAIRMGYTHVANQYSKSLNDLKECA